MDTASMRTRSRVTAVVVFSVAMAWMESATVAYLRTLFNRVEPYQTTPLPLGASFGATELVREAATIIMLAVVGWLAGRSFRSRLGYFIVAFGVWDIFYYVFLRVIVGWPHSIFDWDVLFLIPLPWWGPVLSPVLISLMLIAGGMLTIYFDETGRVANGGLFTWFTCGIGVLLALYTFMADSIRVIFSGSGTLQTLIPAEFNWPLFLFALILMAAPVLQMSYALLERHTIQ